MVFGFKQISSLGDCLYITAALQALKGEEHIIEMHTDKQSHEVSTIFEGLAKVVFMENPRERLYITNQDKTHSAQRVLNSLEIKGVSCIPKIDLRPGEIEWAKKYLRRVKNPIVITNDNLGGNSKTNYCAIYKRPPIDLMQFCTNNLIELGYTVLQFGPKINEWPGGIPTFTPLKGAVYIRELTIREQAACFSVIKKGFFGDTGTYHLMLSVGGKSIIFHPPENKKFGYEIWDLHYLPELWLDEPIRCKYYDYTKLTGEEFPDMLNFLNE